MHSYGEVGRTLVRTLVVIRMRCVKLIVIALCALLVIIGVTDDGGFRWDRCVIHGEVEGFVLVRVCSLMLSTCS